MINCFYALAASYFERQLRKIFPCSANRKRVAFDKLDVIFRVCDNCHKRILERVSLEEKELNDDDSVVKLKHMKGGVMSNREVVFVDGVRTAFGTLGRTLRTLRWKNWAASPLKGLIEKTKISEKAAMWMPFFAVRPLAGPPH